MEILAATAFNTLTEKLITNTGSPGAHRLVKEWLEESASTHHNHQYPPGQTARYAIRNLPKSFQDVISVARVIGIRYLWIGSLCIVQDDHDDWLE